MDRRRYLLAVGLLALGTVAYLAARFIWLPMHDPLDHDFTMFWMGGKFIWLGKDPYDVLEWTRYRQMLGAWIPDPHFVYPLALSLFLAPIGLFPIGEAYALWLGLSTAIVGLTIWGSREISAAPTRDHLTLPLLLGSLIFRPLLLTYYNGQLTPLLLLCFFLGWFMARRGAWFWSGVFLAFSLLKPNTTFIIVGLIGFWMLVTRKWKAVAGVFAGGLGLYVLGAVQRWDWLPVFLAQGSTKLASTLGLTPTLWGVAEQLCGGEQTCTRWAGGILSILSLGATVYLLARFRERLAPAWVFSLAICVGLLVFPYLWPYEQLLLVFPLALISHHLFERGIPFIAAGAIMVGSAILALLYLAMAVHMRHEAPNALVTVQTLCLLAWVIRINLRDTSPARLQDSHGAPVATDSMTA